MNPRLATENKPSTIKIDLEGDLAAPQKTVDLKNIKQYFSPIELN